MTSLHSILPATSMIGSLPHHNVDSAMAFSFQLDIPFLPQIPIRNPWEYMIPQALEGLPGLQVDKDGACVLDFPLWEKSEIKFEELLKTSFAENNFDRFEPSSSVWSSFLPFFWELQERKSHFAKLQICGPMTAQWAIRLSDGNSPEHIPELTFQIFRLVLARATSMIRKIKSVGITPILFLDEPAFFSLNLSNPKHIMGLHEMRLMIQALKKEGALVGIHCCSNTDWKTLIDLKTDIISLDTELSLSSLLSTEASQTFIQNGGILSLGIIPTNFDTLKINLDSKVLFQKLLSKFQEQWGNSNEKLIQKALKQSILTPACGLALLNPDYCESILSSLKEIKTMLSR